MKLDARLSGLLRKLSSLTDEQKKLHSRVAREWQERFFHKCDSLYAYYREAEEMIYWLYEQAGLSRPRVILAASPLEAQQIANRISHSKQDKYRRQYFRPASFGGVSDISWLALYDFFIRMGNQSDNQLLRYRDYIKSLPIFSMIQGNRYCILTDMPNTIRLDDRQRLHAKGGAALAWSDGFSLYYWHGQRTRKAYIMEPEKIDRNSFLAERNVEQRRLILEIMGEKKLQEILDLKEVDRYVYHSRIPVLDEAALNQLSQEEINQLASYAYYEMKEQTYILYRSRYRDELIRDYFFFVQVTDPSTGRQYYLSVSPEDATSAKEAVDATFGENDLAYNAES